MMIEIKVLLNSLYDEQSQYVQENLERKPPIKLIVMS